MSESPPTNNAGAATEPKPSASAIRNGATVATGRIRGHAAPARFLALALFLLPNLPGTQAAGAGSDALLFCSGYASDLKTVFVKGAGKKYQNVRLSIANVIELPETHVEGGKIALYGAPGENGKRPVVAIADVKGVKRPLIVLYPGEQGAETAYGATTVDADTSKFRVGTFQLLNLSPHPVRFSQDEVVIELEHLAARIYPPPKPLGKPLSVSIDYKLGDNWTLLSSSSWAVRNDRRTLVCVLLDPLTGRMNVKSVPLREQPGR